MRDGWVWERCSAKRRARDPGPRRRHLRRACPRPRPFRLNAASAPPRSPPLIIIPMPALGRDRTDAPSTVAFSSTPSGSPGGVFHCEPPSRLPARRPRPRAPGAAEDWTIPQNWHAFTAEEHRVWDLLFARQQERLAGRAVRAFMEGLDLLRLSRPGIPNLAELNRTLKARTGWPRPGRRLLPSPQRTPLYRRQLHRRADQLDYLEEPDVFHDLFGHVPLLADPRMADFMVTLGRLGLRARGRHAGTPRPSLLAYGRMRPSLGGDWKSGGWGKGV